MVDDAGWEYAIEASSKNWSSTMTVNRNIRRRLWRRRRIMKPKESVDVSSCFMYCILFPLSSLFSTHSPSLSLTLPHSPSLPLTLSLTLLHSPSLSLTPLTLSITLPHSPSLSLTPSHSPSLSLTPLHYHTVCTIGVGSNR